MTMPVPWRVRRRGDDHEIGGVEARGAEAQRVAEQCVAAAAELRGEDQQHAAEGERERDQERRPRPLAPQRPGEQRHEQRCAVGLERRGGDRGEQKRRVPQRQITGEEHARPHEQRIAQRGTRLAAHTLAPALEAGPQREERQRERPAPERGRGRSGLRQAHEDARAADREGANKQRDQGRKFRAIGADGHGGHRGQRIIVGRARAASGIIAAIALQPTTRAADERLKHPFAYLGACLAMLSSATRRSSRATHGRERLDACDTRHRRGRRAT